MKTLKATMLNLFANNINKLGEIARKLSTEHETLSRKAREHAHDYALLHGITFV